MRKQGQIQSKSSCVLVDKLTNKQTDQPTSKHAQICMITKQRVSPSILRLHTKIHADRSTISQVMLVFRILIKIPFAYGNKKRFKNS